MALNNYRVGRPAAVPENGRLRFSKRKRRWTLTFIPKKELIERMQD